MEAAQGEASCSRGPSAEDPVALEGLRRKKETPPDQEHIPERHQGGVFDASIDSEVLFKHDQIKKIYNEFGPFVCEEPSVEELGLPAGAHLVEREPFKLTNGAIYIGQWDNECKRRAGIGRQVWPDGSLYQG